MFRIESYITPIILSHIDKYVKDFRPQDAQLSLWGGEVAFQNLDVRLDVLEEEFQLPFDFVSGHIHELTVRVPWTKIASEPIQITINTIEFVLKLKSGDSGGASTKKERKKMGKSEIVQEPPGYMASLVNKIANNISLKLHNIILKYVEEDIVVSMNIQLLTFDSADDNWLPSFNDINPKKIQLKKVINISDLTICLDKRNALGKIDVCQEPILYRCTLQARMLKKYNLSTMHKSSITRIDVFTESIDINVSAQQFPMLLRLLILAKTLKDGRIKPNSDNNNNLNNHPAMHSSDTTIDNDPNGENDESMLSWAWNLIPSILPNFDDFNDDDDEEQYGHYLHTGFYINNLYITFKSQELITDNIVNTTKKIKYHPILKIMLQGIYCKTIMLSTRWFNLSGGVSSIKVMPIVGNCPCGRKHSQFTTTYFHTTNMISNNELDTSAEENNKLYLNDSLMDMNCMENVEPHNHHQRMYNSVWDIHISKITDAHLIVKTPAFAFDIIHKIEFPDDHQSRASSEYGSDFEYSNLSERYLCRAIIGNFTLKYDISFMHIMEKLFEYYNLYDYGPYVEEKIPLTINQLSPASTEDYDALMNDIPIRNYELCIMKSVLELYVFNEPPQTVEEQQLTKNLPFLTIEIDRINANVKNPFYPNRLVHTTCQLPDPPIELLKNCYIKNNFEIDNFTINLNVSDNLQKHQQIFSIDSMKLQSEQLIYPDLWLNNGSSTLKYNLQFSLNNLNVKCNRPQLHFLQIYLDLLMLHKQSPGTKNNNNNGHYRKLNNKKYNYIIESSSVFQDIRDTHLSTIDFKLNRLTTKYLCTIENVIILTGNIHSILCYCYHPNEYDLDQKMKCIIFTSAISNGEGFNEVVHDDYDDPNADSINTNKIMIKFKLQLPMNNLNEKCLYPPIFVCTFNECITNLDPMLLELLQYDKKLMNQYHSQRQDHQQIVDHDDKEMDIDKKHKKSFISNKLQSTSQKKSNNPLESVHSSSEPTATITFINRNENSNVKVDGVESFLQKLKIQTILQCLLIQLDIKQCTIYYPNKTIYSDNNNHNEHLSTVFAKTKDLDYIILKSPFCVLKSSQIKGNLLNINEDYPIKLSDTIWSNDKPTFPWNLTLSQFTCRTIQKNLPEYVFIQPIKTDITIAVTIKPHPIDIATVTDERRQTEDTNAEIKYDYSYVIHIDTGPIEIHLCEEQLKFIYTSIMTITNLLTNDYYQSDTEKIEKQNLEISERSPSPNYHTNLKEFFETSSHTDNSSDDTILQTDDDTTKISIWLQWTLTKFTITLYSSSKKTITDSQHKCIIEFEDIITSLDKQDVYMKMKLKLGSINGICKIKESNSLQWQQMEVLGVIARSDITQNDTNNIQDTFFEITVTRAITNNVHNKWGQSNRSSLKQRNKQRNPNLNETITEIMFYMQTIDIKLDILMLCKFLPIFSMLSTNSNKDDGKRHGVIAKQKEKILSVSDLPLIYCQSKGIRIFIPMLNNSNLCNVLIFKINSITITPTVENPLNRIPVRGDIYTKAEQLRILHVPGSKIEDRQYEIVFQNISIGSGNWNEIVKCIDDPNKNSDSYNENPAFEWNNQMKKSTVEINTIFKDFNLSITYAPCIIFKNVLICGEGLEINCLTDLKMQLTVHEITLMHKILNDLQHVSENYSSKSIKSTVNTIIINDQKLLTKQFEGKLTKRMSSCPSTIDMIDRNSIKNQMFDKHFHQDNQLTDSGFESSGYQSNRNKLKGSVSVSGTVIKEDEPIITTSIVKDEPKTIPFVISFVGGIFSFKFYDTLEYCCSTEIDKNINSSQEMNIKYPIKYSLISFTFFQPNLLISQSVFDKTTQLSLYNMNIDLGCDLVSGGSSHNKRINPDDAKKLFNTHKGELDNFGIPPSLFNFKEYITPTKDKHLECHIRKPIQINLTMKSIEKLYSLYVKLNKIFQMDNNSNNTTKTSTTKLPPPPPIKTNKSIIPINKKIKIIKQLLYDANKIDFSINSTELNLSTIDGDLNNNNVDDDVDNVNDSVDSTVQNNNIKNDIKLTFSKFHTQITILNYPEKLNFKMTLNSLMLFTEMQKQIILNPCTITVTGHLIQEYWLKSPLLSFKIISDCIEFNLGPNIIKNLINVQNSFIKYLNMYDKSKTDLTDDDDADDDEKLLKSNNSTTTSPNFTNNNRNFIQIITPKCDRIKDSHIEEIYQDDLRAGAFQFVESSKEESTSLPLPYQIQILTNDGGIICWRYPQPRALNYIRVLPVPFYTSNNNIKCKIEYYSEPHGTFLPFNEFNLSENDSQSIELPKYFKITAEIWRIKMIQPMISFDGKYFQEDDDDDDDDDEDDESLSSASSGSSAASSSSSSSSASAALSPSKIVHENVKKKINDIDKKNDNTKIKKPIKKSAVPKIAYDTYLMNDTTQTNRLFNLHPKALVGCIRIDSCFSTKLIPNIQAVFNIPHFTITLKNDIDLMPLNEKNSSIKMPKLLKHYKQTSDMNTTHSFFTFELQQFKSHLNLYNDMNIQIITESFVNCNVLDYSYLTMQPLLEISNLKVNIEFCLDNNNLRMNTSGDNLHINYGPSIVHTLTVSKRIWNQTLRNTIVENMSNNTNNHNNNNNEIINEPKQPFRKQKAIIVTRFVICNSTSILFQFGQYKSDEKIFLQSKHCCSYAFRSDRLEQKLQFSIEHNNNWIVSQPILIGTGDTKQYYRLLNNQLFYITNEELSITQRKITIKGQIEFYSMTNDLLRIQLKDLTTKQTNNNSNENELTSPSSDTGVTRNILADFELNGKCNGISVFTNCDQTSLQCIKLRVCGPNKKGWSGEIPLQKNVTNTPWLVKVPMQSDNQEYISYWVRVLREDITSVSEPFNGFKPQRILIIIWPLFIIKSLLPMKTMVYEKTSKSTYELNGRGKSIELQIAGTHETEHQLEFPESFNSSSGADKRNALLSYKVIDKNHFFDIPKECVNIENAIEELEKHQEMNWPCSRDEELRCIRKLNLPDVIVPIYKFLPSRNFSCSLMLNILPLGLFINSSGMDIKILNTIDNSEFLIESNKIGMPTVLSQSFQISLNINSNWINTNGLYLNNTKPKDKSKPYYTVPDEGSIIIEVLSNYGLCKMTLNSLNENGVRVFILSSYFVICNYTNIDMHLWAFCILPKEKQDLHPPPASSSSSSSTTLSTTTTNVTTGLFIAPKNRNQSLNYKGIGISLFANISKQYKDYKDKQKLLFNYFLILRIVNDDYSIPILLNNTIGRLCISILNEFNEYIPLSICIIEHQGQQFLSIYYDICPIMVIDNKTNFNLYVAESKYIGTTKPSNPLKTIGEEHFNCLRRIPTMRRIFFTPPSMNHDFPEKLCHHVGIMFALDKSILPDDSTISNILRTNVNNITNNNAIQWSMPIEIFESMEFLLELPSYGDIKVYVFSDRKVITVVIDDINHKKEFNVKDIRTKLQYPSTNSMSASSTSILENNSQSSKQELMDKKVEEVREGENDDQEEIMLTEKIDINNKKFSAASQQSNTNSLKCLPITNRSDTDNPMPPTGITYECNIYFKEINVNFFTDDQNRNYMKTDLIALYFDDVFGYYDGKKANTLEFGFNNIQIDNQLYSNGQFDFPVIICADDVVNSQRNDHSSVVGRQQSTINLSNPFDLLTIREQLKNSAICRFNVQYYKECNTFAIETIHIIIQPIRAYIEDKYLNELVDYLFENLTALGRLTAIFYDEDYEHMEEHIIGCDDGDDADDCEMIREHLDNHECLIPNDVFYNSLNLFTPVKLNSIKIDPLSILLSAHTSMRVYIALDHSPLNFTTYERRNVYTLPMRFGYNTGMHYVSGALFGAGWVVGSLEILGSPSGLARSLSAGLRDFLSMPVQGLLRGPWGFIVGITNGSASLLRNVTAGTVNSVTKLAASVARNLDRLTLDNEHFERTEALRRLRPQGITHGIVQGLTGLGLSILGAVGGIARHTLEARSSVEVVTGFGRGLVGVVTKPISGAAELVALTGQGMLHTVGFNTMPIARKTLRPRNFSIGPCPDKISWKYLPTIGCSTFHQIIFSALATSIISNLAVINVPPSNAAPSSPSKTAGQRQLNKVMIALTVNLFIMISIDCDEQIEILSIDKLHGTIDEHDNQLIKLKILLSTNENDTNGNVIEGYQYGRVLQYVQELSDQLPTSARTDNQNQLGTTDGGQFLPSAITNSSTTSSGSNTITATNNNKQNKYRTVQFYMDEYHCRYFIDYLNLLKCNI